MTDRFDKLRETMDDEVVDNFLAIFGMGPKYKPSTPKKYLCPKCGKHNAVYKEIHPDTDMNEIVLSCPDCGYEESN